jgi:predicted porin
MKKTLLLATCLTAATLGAQAQSTVQLMGLADAYVGSIRMAGDAASKSVVGSGGMTTSWWGMSGSEDLGGGLKASFALNGFFRTDTGEAGRFGPDTQFSRDAYVSLSGGFGALALGRGKAPNFLPTIVFNPMGDSFTFSPLVLHASNTRTLPGDDWIASNPSDTGWSNQITYTTPDMAGLKANLHYQPGEVANDNGKKNIGFNLMYASGPLGLTAFWEKDQVKNPVPAVLEGSATRTNWMLGGSYDATVVKGFMTYGKSSSDLAGVADQKTLSLGLSAPVGNGKVLAAYAKTKVDQGNTRDTVTVGYDYNLSKRTDLYAMLMNDKISNFESGNSLGLGVRHRF